MQPNRCWVVDCVPWTARRPKITAQVRLDRSPKPHQSWGAFYEALEALKPTTGYSVITSTGSTKFYGHSIIAPEDFFLKCVTFPCRTCVIQVPVNWGLCTTYQKSHFPISAPQ